MKSHLAALLLGLTTVIGCGDDDEPTDPVTSSRMQDGQPDWKIIEWRDKSTGTGGGLSGTHETSWGEIKLIFH